MGPRQRQGHGRSKTHALPVILLSLLGFLLIAGVAFGIGMIGNVNRWLSDLPDYTDANAYLVSELPKLLTATAIPLRASTRKTASPSPRTKCPRTCCRHR